MIFLDKKNKFYLFPFLSKNENEILKFEKEYPNEYYERYISSFKINNKKNKGYLISKRVLDLFFSVLLLIILLPILLIISLAIIIDSKGPIVFKQVRIGKNGKEFTIYKFRTLKSNTDPYLTSEMLKGSDYYTKVGKFLRKTSLDELLQLINIIKGDMSFIGPRPINFSEKELNDMRKELNVFDMRPGITGFAQINGRDKVYYKNKVIMDAYYVNNACFKFDLKIILKTIASVLKKEDIII